MIPMLADARTLDFLLAILLVSAVALLLLYPSKSRPKGRR
jgi:hypothetical protein